MASFSRSSRSHRRASPFEQHQFIQTHRHEAIGARDTVGTKTVLGLPVLQRLFGGVRPDELSVGKVSMPSLACSRRTGSPDLQFREICRCPGMEQDANGKRCLDHAEAGLRRKAMSK